MIGLTVIEEILRTKHKWKVYALYRSKNNITVLNQLLEKYPSDNEVILVQGDITDLESLRRHIPERADAVLHIAAATSQWSGENDLLIKVNVEGTKNVITACLEKGVKKLVYTSSIAAYAPGDGARLDENSPKLGEQHVSYYNKTKYRSEIDVLKAVREDGLPAVILNPTQVIGKYDTGSWVQLFHAVMNKALPVIGAGGGCFAHGREVAKAHIAAIDNGRVGENYILGGPSHSFLELATEILKLRGESYSPKVAPNFVFYTLGFVLDWYSYLWSHKKPLITPAIDARLTTAYYVDCTKARNELGYNDNVPFEQVVLEEYNWVVNPEV